MSHAVPCKGGSCECPCAVPVCSFPSGVLGNSEDIETIEKIILSVHCHRHQKPIAAVGVGDVARREPRTAPYQLYSSTILFLAKANLDNVHWFGFLFLICRQLWATWKTFRKRLTSEYSQCLSSPSHQWLNGSSDDCKFSSRTAYVCFTSLVLRSEEFFTAEGLTQRTRLTAFVFREL